MHHRTHSMLLACTLLLLLGGCGQGESHRVDTPDALVLRVYDVPAWKTDDIAMALNDVLDGSEHLEGVGTASRRIPGKLLVAAPAGLHGDIDEVIDALVTSKEGEGSEAPGGSVRLSFWVIEAIDAPVSDPRLAAIEPALARLRTLSGDTQFALVDHMSTTAALPNGNGRIEAVSTTAEFRLEPGGGDVLANLDIVNRVANPEVGSTEHRSSVENIPLQLDGYILLHMFLVGGSDAEGGSRMRSVILQAERLDRG